MGRKRESELCGWDPKDGELCPTTVKDGETHLEAESRSDVQIDDASWVKRRKTHRAV